VVTGEYVLCRGVNANAYHNLVPVKLECPLATVSAAVAVVDELPVDGVDFLLGNDLAGAQVFPPPVIVSERALTAPDTESPLEEDGELFPVCAVTRSMSQLAARKDLRETRQVASAVEAAPVALEEPWRGACRVKPGRLTQGSWASPQCLLRWGVP